MANQRHGVWRNRMVIRCRGDRVATRMARNGTAMTRWSSASSISGGGHACTCSIISLIKRISFLKENRTIFYSDNFTHIIFVHCIVFNTVPIIIVKLQVSIFSSTGSTWIQLNFKIIKKLIY